MSADPALESLRGAALAHLRTLIEGVTSGDRLTSRDVVRLMEQVASSATAIQAMAIASMVEEAEHASADDRSSEVLVPDPEFVPDEVALALHCSTITAHRRVQVAQDAARHPALMTMWCAVTLSPTAVQVVTELVDSLDPTVPATYDLVTDAADYAAEHTPSQTRAWLTHRALAADPEAAEDRRRRAMADRRVVFTPGVDSMGSLWALLPGVQARQVYQTVNALAVACGADDARTMDQRRADALVDLVTGRAAPPQVQVQVVVSEAALTGSGALTVTSPSGSCVPTPTPASWWPWVSASTVLRLHSAGRSGRGMWCAAFPDAGRVRLHPALTSTTRCRGRPAPPPRATWRLCVAGTIASSTHPAGRCSSSPTDT